MRRPHVCSILGFIPVVLALACAREPANVGDTAGEAATDGTGGDSSSATLSASTTSTDTMSSTDPSGAQTSADAGDGPPEIDCPDPEFPTCAGATRGLVDQVSEAVALLRERFEGGRALIAAELGVPGQTLPTTLSVALGAAVGGHASLSETIQCEALGGAREFWAACHGHEPTEGFGCEGRCTITEALIPTCLEDGQVACRSSEECSGNCHGTCMLDFGFEGSCEGLCGGTCSGECDCTHPAGFCVGICTGQCNGTCSLLLDGGPCTGTCAGACSSKEMPQSGTCEGDDLEGCFDGGPGTCFLDCHGVPTPPADTDPCCADLVGLAGGLSAECNPPFLRWPSEPGCSAEGGDFEAVDAAVAELLVVQLLVHRLLEESAPLTHAMQTPPPDLPPGTCEVEL